MGLKHESEPALWDRFWGERELGLYPNLALISCIQEITGNSIKGKWFLEVGCGRGSDSIALARMGGKCFAIDFSSNSIALSKRLAEQQKVNIIPFSADTRALPFLNNSFDLTFSQGLIEHYQPPDNLISEQIRVVKPGGSVLVDVPQLLSLQAVSKKILMKINKWPFGWERDYTESQLKDLIEKLGLEFITSYGWGCGPVLGLGIRSFLHQKFGGEVSFPLPPDFAI